MAFIALFGWIFFLLIPLFYIFTAIEAILTWALAHLFIVNIIVGILLMGNLLLLAVLLWVRSLWKRSGRMERAYINGFTGLRRLGLLLVKYTLFLWPAWEGFLVLLCVLYLVIQPLRFLIPA